MAVPSPLADEPALVGEAAPGSYGCLDALPIEVLLVSLSPSLNAINLARLCGASKPLHKLSTAFAAIVASEHHGMNFAESVNSRLEGQHLPGHGGLSALREIFDDLDSIPQGAPYDFTVPSMATMLQTDHGPEFMMVNVGGGHTQTVAACPPMCGDTWALQVPLKRGSYVLDVLGWRNPHHGVLDIYWDGTRLSPPDGFDWYSEEMTELHRFGPVPFDVPRTGTYTLRGETKRCHGRALGARHWICLKSLCIVPASQYNTKVLEACGLDGLSAGADPVITASSFASMGALASSLGNADLAARVWTPFGLAANEDVLRANAVLLSGQRVRHAVRLRTTSWWCGQPARVTSNGRRISWLRSLVLHAGAATAAFLLAARKLPEWFT